jgi:hypothetical protein
MSQSQSHSNSSSTKSGAVPEVVKSQADEWISCIDESIHQEYWYNTRTGEMSWA